MKLCSEGIQMRNLKEAKMYSPLKRKLMRILILMMVPFVLCLTFFNIYVSNKIIKTSIFENYEYRTGSLAQSLDNTLNNALRYMSYFIARGTEFYVFQYPTDDSTLFDITQNIISQYKYIMYTDPRISGFMLFSEINDYYRVTYNPDYTKHNINVLHDYLIEKSNESHASSRSWQLSKIEGEYYLTLILGNKGAYQMCFINVNDLLNQMCEDLKTTESLILCDSDSNSILAASRGSPLINTLDFSDKNYIIDNQKGAKNIYSSCTSSALPVLLVLVSPYQTKVDAIFLVLFLATVLLCGGLIPIGISLLLRQFIKPIHSLTETMNEISAGNMDSRSQYNGNISEFRQMSDTFNAMLNQIDILELQSYQQRMEAQQTELQFLHLQIRPHFYLNCLKIIYGMAECQQFRDIQEMLLLLSEYFRSILRLKDMVSLAEEIHRVETFITLTNFSNRNNIVLEIHMDETLNDMMLPSLSILTFVENSVKHAQSLDKKLIISVKATLLRNGEESYANISIADNGPGFPESLINQLNHGEYISEDGDAHLGIRNICERLNYVYSGRSSITFISSGGAGIELFIPYDCQHQENKK